MKPAAMLRRAGIVRLGELALLFGVASAFAAGHWLTAARHVNVGLPPPELVCEDVSFASPSGATLRGWFARGSPGRGAVLLLHGVRGTRGAMVARAAWLARGGRAVLLFDFSAHGASSGERIGFGAREALDARAALAELRARVPGERVAAIGQSLGGAAALLGDEPLDVDALVLEQVYSTIEDATRNRMRHYFGPLAAIGAALTPLVLAEGEWFSGVARRELQPIERIARLRAPLFFIAGAEDPFTPVDEARRLWERAPEPKELWVVPALRHVDVHAHSRDEYERRVGEFLERWLTRER